MPWEEVSIMSQRHEFMLFAHHRGGCSPLCRRFEINPTTAYKWLVRQTGKELPGSWIASAAPIRRCGLPGRLLLAL